MIKYKNMKTIISYANFKTIDKQEKIYFKTGEAKKSSKNLIKSFF